MSGYAFGFYEVVEILPRLDPPSVQFGAVLGRSGIETGRPGYAVHVFDSAMLPSRGECVCFEESELRATGRRMTRADFYDGSSVRVGRDGDILE